MDNSTSHSCEPSFGLDYGILENDFSIDAWPMHTPVLSGSSPVDVIRSEGPSPPPGNLWTPIHDPIVELGLVGAAPIFSLPATLTDNQRPRGGLDQSRTAARKAKAKALRLADWESFKDCIVDLHIQQKKPLPQVREIMMHEHGFDAT